MSSIRPLVTITILVVVGAYLYVKINEGPVRPAAENDKWLSAPTELPPLDTTVGAPTVATETAAPWPATTQANTQPLENTSNLNGSGSGQMAVDTTSAAEVPSTLPAVPEIPALPDVSEASNATAPAATVSVPPPTDLPENIPTARYPDDPVPAAAAPNGPVVGTPPHSASSAETMVQPNAALDAGTTMNATVSPSSALASEPQQSTPSPNPLRQAAQPSVKPDLHASSVYSQNLPTTGARVPVEPAFSASWPEIKTALDRRELARAHQLLTKWHDDPSLTPAEAEQVETLLGQLAGTVVYSTEHQLEPARAVKPDESLETIAKEYSVPWQLLAKINGIAAVDQVRPGQELKVVRGPFAATVDLTRKQMTLFVDGRYAGKFPVTAANVPQIGEGEWVVAGYTDAPRAMLLNRPSETAANTAIRGVLLGAATPAESEQLGVGMVSFSKADSTEVTEILSVGSRVIIRR